MNVLLRALFAKNFDYVTIRRRREWVEFVFEKQKVRVSYAVTPEELDKAKLNLVDEYARMAANQLSVIPSEPIIDWED